MMKENTNNGLLLVANWDSSTGYAWWLMESFWLLLGRHYTDQGRAVHLVYPSISTLPNAIENSTITVSEIDFKRCSLLSLYQFIKNNRIGCVYLSDYSICNIRYLVCRIAGAKYIIVHEHTPGTRDVPGKLKLLIKKAMHRLPLLCVSAMIATTNYIKQRQINVGGMPREKCFCASNGLPEQVPVETVDVHQQYAIPLERMIMVTTGRANKYKGIDFALSVMAELVKKQGRQDIHYLFCGDGPDLAEFKQSAQQKGISDYVTFSGHLDNVAPHLLSCDFAIHPSKGEVGYSLSILEYMQSKLAVIVPDNPSVCGASIDGDNGFIYKQDDLYDAAAKIQKLLDDPELNKTMGEKAKMYVMENYKLSHTHEQLLQAFTAITE